MRIKLIVTASPGDTLRKKEPFMPLSLPLLAGAAPDHDYELVDMLWDPTGIDYDAPVDLVGLSVRLTAERHAYEIADEYRKRGVPVVLGGPQPSAVPHRAIGHADAVVVGEAEETWPVLLEDAARSSLRSFYVCSPTPFDGRGRSVHQVDRFPDLATIPAPRRDLFAKKNYVFDTVFASRGCPIDCDFCSVTGLFGAKTRLRPIDDVVREIDSFPKKGFFYLLDDNVFGRGGTRDYYLELYRAIAGLDRPYRFWTGQVNLDAVASEKGREVVRAAVESGFLYAAAGLESIDPAVQERSGTGRKMGVDRGSDVVSQMKDHIAFLQDLGVIVSGWFVVGYEEDTVDTFYETYEFCKETNVFPVVSALNAIPGTRLYSRLEREGKLDESYTLTNIPHPTMTKEDVLAALRHIADEGFSLRENLRRTLFYRRKFNARGGTVEARMRKTITAFLVQHNMAKVLRAENENLASDVSQNYSE